MSKIKKIVIHCSDSNFGTAIMIDQWHRKRGWRCIGYMGVICNGYPLPPTKNNYWPEMDGTFEWGRPLDNDNQIEGDELEAHAYGINKESVGICLIGKYSFTQNQIFNLIELCDILLHKWDLKVEDVIGHYEVSGSKKTCPNIDMKNFRNVLKLFREDKDAYIDCESKDLFETIALELNIK